MRLLLPASEPTRNDGGRQPTKGGEAHSALKSEKVQFEVIKAIVSKDKIKVIKKLISNGATQKGTTDNIKKIIIKNVGFGIRDNRNYMHSSNYSEPSYFT